MTAAINFEVRIVTMPENVYRYGMLTREQFIKAVSRPSVMLLPLSAPENHGDHLPLGADYVIAEEIAERAARAFAENHPDRSVFLHPTWPIGAATIRGPGSLKVRYPIFRRLLISYGKRVYKQGIKGLVIVSGHGGVGHVAAMDDACKKLNRLYGRKGFAAFAPAAKLAGMTFSGAFIDAWRRDGIDIPDDVAVRFGEDLHAGFLETSLLYGIMPKFAGKNPKEQPVVRVEVPGYLKALAGCLSKLVRALPVGDEKKAQLDEGLRVGAVDLAWIIRGRLEGYIGDPSSFDPKLGEAMLDTVASNTALWIKRVCVNGESPDFTFSVIANARYLAWAFGLFFLLLAAAIVGVFL